MENAPKGKILKSDVNIAKNYLKEREIGELNRLVELYLNYAELQAERQRVLKMNDWAKKLDAFLQFNEYELLNHTGKVSAAIAKATAEEAFEEYRIIQDKTFISDFDQMINQLGIDS